LTDLISPLIAQKTGKAVTAEGQKLIEKSMNGLKERAKSVISLADSSLFLIADRPLALDDKASKLLDDVAKGVLSRLADRLEHQSEWTKESAESAVRAAAESEELKLGKIAQPLRAALTGTTVSPGIFDVLEVLGREESIGRIRDAVSAP
jgi:glutamyl-tRNA synthetase